MAINKEQKILDPCVGPGIFIKRLLKIGVDINQLFAFDINSKYKSDIELSKLSEKILNRFKI